MLGGLGKGPGNESCQKKGFGKGQRAIEKPHHPKSFGKGTQKLWKKQPKSFGKGTPKALEKAPQGFEKGHACSLPNMGKFSH